MTEVREGNQHLRALTAGARSFTVGVDYSVAEFFGSRRQVPVGNYKASVDYIELREKAGDPTDRSIAIGLTYMEPPVINGMSAVLYGAAPIRNTAITDADKDTRFQAGNRLLANLVLSTLTFGENDAAKGRAIMDAAKEIAFEVVDTDAFCDASRKKRQFVGVRVEADDPWTNSSGRTTISNKPVGFLTWEDYMQHPGPDTPGEMPGPVKVVESSTAAASLAGSAGRVSTASPAVRALSNMAANVSAGQQSTAQPAPSALSALTGQR